MEWNSYFQIILTFLLAFFSIIPEFKVNSNRNGESRTALHKIILIAKKPLVRIVTLIFLVIGLYVNTKVIEEISSKQASNEIDKRDSARTLQAYHLQKAITDKLDIMGYQYDSIDKVLIKLKDSVKRITNIYRGDKPLLSIGFRVDSISVGEEKLNIEIRMAGANAKSINILTSIAAIVNGEPILIYNKHKAFANNESLGKEIQQKNFSFGIKFSKPTNDYIVYQKGTYSDMNGYLYPVDNIYLITKQPPHSSDMPAGALKEVRKFFNTGKKFSFQ